MIVNERLYHSSKLENYDKAVEEKNIDEIRNILEALGGSLRDHSG